MVSKSWLKIVSLVCSGLLVAAAHASIPSVPDETY
ncbi:hypothetical protein SAMN05216419_102137, partial [Nitrosomonas cryotolerans]